MNRRDFLHKMGISILVTWGLSLFPDWIWRLLSGKKQEGITPVDWRISGFDRAVEGSDTTVWVTFSGTTFDIASQKDENYPSDPYQPVYNKNEWYQKTTNFPNLEFHTETLQCQVYSLEDEYH